MTPQPARPALVLARAVAARACRGVVIDSLAADIQRAVEERRDATWMNRVNEAVDALLRDAHGDSLVLAGVAARATWELLPEFDLIGRDWIEDERRWFDGGTVVEKRAVLARDEPSRAEVRTDAGLRRTLPITTRHGDRLLFPCPPTVRACIALAADAANMRAAEDLARETAARLAPWRTSGVLNAPPAPIVWRFGVVPQSLQRSCLRWATAAIEGMPHTDAERAEIARLLGDQTDDDVAARMLRRDQARAWLYDQLAARASWAEVARGNPFASLLDLWGTGYALDDIDDERISLVCPLPPAGTAL